ncbi:MAG: RNA polymerase sigma factor [Pseudomonadales bacterium]|jgi:RNA polymerase sigma-70 factor (ECF subfamily)|nr:RNA polymerase sigma factor [Pseudomonadales bacterium]
MSEIFRVFEKHRAALRRVVRRHLGSQGDPDDVLQEAFLRAYGAELKRGVEQPKAFLFQVARNTALGERRRASASPMDGSVDPESDGLSTHAVGADAADVLDGRRKLHAFTMAVLQLPPRCRRAFLLRRMEGLSYKQIANRMGISVSAAEKHVANGLLRCHDYLTERGYEPSEFGRPERPAPAGGRPRSADEA